MSVAARTILNSRSLAWGLLAAYALGFFALVFAHASDTPQGDDYAAILEPAVRWPTLETWSERIALLSEQHFSHRLVLTKSLVVAQIALFGTVNFLALQILGWGALLVFIGLLVSSSREIRALPWLAAPVVLVIFQPQGFTNFQIAMQAIQNLGILLVALVALQATVSTRPGAGIASVPLAAAAAFVSANGLLVGPVALGAAALRRRYSLAAAHAVATSLVVIVYFRGFGFSSGNSFDLGELLAKAAIMAGGATGFDRLPLFFVGLAGVALLVAALVLLLRPSPNETAPVLRPFLAFLLASVFLAALGRLGWPNDYMTQDRYRLYGCLIACVIYLGLIAGPAGRSRVFRIATVIATAGFASVSFASTLPVMISSARWAEAQAINAQLGQPFFLTSGGGWDEAARLITAADERGIYRLPQLLSDTELHTVRATSTAPHHSSLTPRPNGSLNGFVLTAEHVPGTVRPEFAVLALEDRHVVLPARLSRAPLGEFLRHGRILAPTVAFLLPREIGASGSRPLTAFRRSREGRLIAQWQAVTVLPLN